jgi:lysophospholipase L1-like esterase
MKTILCYGDSNVWGSVANDTETDAPSLRYGEHVRWTSVLADTLSADYRVIEEGLCGRTTIYHIPAEAYKQGDVYLLPCLMSHRPLDLVVMMLGTNDLRLVYQADREHLEKGITRLVDIVKDCPACGTGAVAPKILLVSPILITRPTGRKDYFIARGGDECMVYVQRFAAAYEQVAKEKDCYFLDAALYGEPDPADGMHLTRASHERLGRAVAAKVAEIFE